MTPDEFRARRPEFRTVSDAMILLDAESLALVFSRKAAETDE